MRILLNGSTMHDGGGMQVLINYIIDSLNDPNDIDWYYLVSERVKFFLDRAGVILPESKSLVLIQSPSKFSGRINVLKKVEDFEKANSFDMVYSISSPSYINFNCKEVQRLTNPYITNPNRYAYSVYPPVQRFKRHLKTAMQRYLLRKCRYFITQTDIAAQNLIKSFSLPENNVKVVPNAVSGFFRNYKIKENVKPENYIFCLFTPNPHKNLNVLPVVAHYLKEGGNTDFTFLTTIEPDHPALHEMYEKAKELGVLENFKNLGRLTQTECAEYYQKSKVSFLPTYLEVFSATLIESMFMGVPMVTTNFDFNVSVAKDAAYFFEPGDWTKAAKGLKEILYNDEFRDDLIARGNKRILDFPDSTQCYKMTNKYLKQIYNS